MAAIASLALGALGLFRGMSGGGGDNGAAAAKEQQVLSQARQEQVAQENQALQAKNNGGLLSPRTGRRALISGSEGGISDSTLG